MARILIGVVSLALVIVTIGLAQSRVPTPVATIGQIQRAMVSPASDVIFNAGSVAPETDEEWQTLEDAAVILTEAGNLYMMDGRRKDDGLWMELAGAMADTGAAALAAAEAQNVDGVFDAGNTLIEICEACHQPYRDGGRPMGPPPEADDRR